MTILTQPVALPLAAALLCGVQPSLAQTQTQQKITGPEARYWVSAEVASGFSPAAMSGGGGGLASIMGAVLGGGGPRKTLKLELGSVKAANPAEAVHALPPALGMGASLPLLGEQAEAKPEPVERDIPETREAGERPKGRMLFFWGCGETAGPGQPVVLDMDKLANGVLPPNMRSVTIRAQRSGPGFARDKGYAEWPNRKDNTGVPAQASLVGAHSVSGGFIPEIRFSVGSEHDFMDALALQQAPSAGGGHRLAWNNLRTALGYFANGMGFKQGANEVNDIVFWNSSSVRLLGGEQLMGFLAPAETERLVRDKVVLAPATTECTVPKEVIAAAGGPLTMVNLNAYGPELNVVHPPRPADPKVDWNQIYAVKLRQRATTGSVGGMGDAALRNAQREAPPAEQAPPPPGEKPSVADTAKTLLKGLFGK